VVIVGRSKIVGKFGLLTGNMVKPGAAVIAAARQREHYHNQFGQHVKIA
jgi:5,10-methylene-tetrahydrofolate dehydrogenase/methenyl tetrahydrofolate cyclohydrolase